MDFELVLAPAIVLTNGGIGEEQLLSGCIDVDIDVVRVCVCEKVGCCVALTSAVEQRPPYLCADQVLIRLSVVRCHARF